MFRCCDVSFETEIGPIDFHCKYLTGTQIYLKENSFLSKPTFCHKCCQFSPTCIESAMFLSIKVDRVVCVACCLLRRRVSALHCYAQKPVSCSLHHTRTDVLEMLQGRRFQLLSSRADWSGLVLWSRLSCAGSEFVWGKSYDWLLMLFHAYSERGTPATHSNAQFLNEVLFNVCVGRSVYK